MKKIPALILIFVASVAFAGCALWQKPIKTVQPTQQNNQQTAPAQDVAPNNAPANNNPAPQVTQNQPYTTYSPELVSQYANQGKKVVLFFHAAWCPTCKAAEKDITERINEIPNDIVILKVDYDTSSELKKKYNITYQHTFVQVDANGNAITIWNGGDLDDIIKKAQ